MSGYRNASDEKIREDRQERTGSWLCVGNNEELENNEDVFFKSCSLFLGRFRDKEDYLIRVNRRYTPEISQNITTEIDHEDD